MSAITTVIIARQNLYIRIFRQAGALSAGSSIRPADYGIRDSLPFNRLVRKGVFVPVGEDFFYLDEEKEKQVRNTRSTVLVVVSIVLLIIMLSIMYTHH